MAGTAPMHPIMKAILTRRIALAKRLADRHKMMLNQQHQREQMALQHQQELAAQIQQQREAQFQEQQQPPAVGQMPAGAPAAGPSQ